METTVPAERLSVSGRGLDALRATRPWALVAGVAALIAAVLTLANAVYFSIVSPARVLSTSPDSAKLASSMSVFYIGVGVLDLFIYGALGWLALDYGRRLGRMLRTGEAGELEAALWRQRRCWTFEGVLIIIFIALGVLGMIAAIIIGVTEAAHHY
ncbi:MAG: hypothetical protein ACRES7_09190 [Gammaproteobacteria bacterium]